MKTFSFDTIVRDPGVFADNRLPAHSDHVTYASAAEMAAGESSLRMRLDGLWKFRYSATPASAPDGFWEKDFDLMAIKTMYRQLIGKYGIMSIEMQRAYVADGAANPISVGGEDTEPVYFDSPDTFDADFSEVDNETGEVNA
jgi:recombinational DNA repair protein RecT